VHQHTSSSAAATGHAELPRLIFFSLASGMHQQTKTKVFVTKLRLHINVQSSMSWTVDFGISPGRVHFSRLAPAVFATANQTLAQISLQFPKYPIRSFVPAPARTVATIPRWSWHKFDKTFFMRHLVIPSPPHCSADMSRTFLFASLDSHHFKSILCPLILTNPLSLQLTASREPG